MRYLQEWMGVFICKMHRLAGRVMLSSGAAWFLMKRHIGELVVNQKIADDVLEIMKESLRKSSHRKNAL